MLTLDTRSPECGWEPFMAWLAAEGIKAEDVASMSIDTDSLVAEVVLYKRLLGKKTGDRKTKTVQLSSPPVLHPSRSVAS